MLNSFPSCVCITFCSFIHLLVDILLVASVFWLLSEWVLLSVLLGKYLGVMLLGHVVILCVTFWGTSKTISHSNSTSSSITFLIVSFEAQKFLLWMKYILFFVWLLVLLVSNLRNHCLIQGEDLFLYFLLTVLVLTFRPMIYFQLLFLYEVREMSNFILLHSFVCGYQIAPASLMRRLFFSHWSVLAPV